MIFVLLSVSPLPKYYLPLTQRGFMVANYTMLQQNWMETYLRPH